MWNCYLLFELGLPVLSGIRLGLRFNVFVLIVGWLEVLGKLHGSYWSV